MVDAGMDVARIGLAHGTLDEALGRMRRVRQVSQEAGRRVGVLVDLPGPKVRTASFGHDGVELLADTEVQIRVGDSNSTAEVVEVDYANLFHDIATGDQVALGDGQVLLEIVDIADDRANCAHTPRRRLSMGGPVSASPPTGSACLRLPLKTCRAWKRSSAKQWTWWRCHSCDPETTSAGWEWILTQPDRW